MSFRKTSSRETSPARKITAFTTVHMSTHPMGRLMSSVRKKTMIPAMASKTARISQRKLAFFSSTPPLVSFLPLQKNNLMIPPRVKRTPSAQRMRLRRAQDRSESPGSAGRVVVIVAV